MVFDETNLKLVAGAVIRLNVHARGSSIEDMVNRMKGLAYRELSDGCVYVATGGFMLTAYREPSGELAIKASVSDCLFSPDPDEEALAG